MSCSTGLNDSINACIEVSAKLIDLFLEASNLSIMDSIDRISIPLAKETVLKFILEFGEEGILVTGELTIKVIDDMLSCRQCVLAIAHFFDYILWKHVNKHGPLAVVWQVAAEPRPQVRPLSQIVTKLLARRTRRESMESPQARESDLLSPTLIVLIKAAP